MDAVVAGFGFFFSFYDKCIYGEMKWVSSARACGTINLSTSRYVLVCYNKKQNKNKNVYMKYLKINLSYYRSKMGPMYLFYFILAYR